MVTQSKTISISINQNSGIFSSILNKFKSAKRTELENLRQLLSNERARLIHKIKTNAPDSIYELAKLLNRDFKAVREDVKLLEHFGILELIVSHKEGRERLKPVITTDKLIIAIDL